MTVFKSPFYKLISTSLALVLASGCSQNTRTPVDTDKTLTVWTLQLQDYKPYFDNLFAQYEKQHPGIKINWVDIPFAEGEKKTLTAILSGHPPDVINLNPDFSAVLADKHAILNLNTLLSAQQKQNYLPITLESCSLKNTQFLFGLPWYLTSQVTYYNQQLLHQAGWKTPPRSDAELLKLAKDLKQKNLNDVTAFYPTLADNGKFSKQLWQRGLDSPQGSRQYLLFWKTMLDNNLLPQESITMKYQDTVDRYQSGASVLLMSGTTAVKGLQENAPQIYKQTRVMPQFPANSSNVDFSVMTLVVPKQSRHPKEAVDLAAFMTNPQNTFAFSRLAPILPPGPSLKRNEFLFPKSNDLQSQAIAMSARQVLKSKHGYQIGHSQKAKNDATDFYVQSVLLNRMSINDAVKTGLN